MKHFSKLILVVGLLTFTACTTTSRKPDRFAIADTNRDGKLSYNEVSDYYVVQVFTARDTNMDGKITKPEWNREAMSKEDARAFALRDANKDGAVALAEAEAYARKNGVFRASAKEADMNHDGFVSREEARAYFASKE